jgi:hypothetical protein
LYTRAPETTTTPPRLLRILFLLLVKRKLDILYWELSKSREYPAL